MYWSVWNEVEIVFETHEVYTWFRLTSWKEVDSVNVYYCARLAQIYLFH